MQNESYILSCLHKFVVWNYFFELDLCAHAYAILRVFQILLSVKLLTVHLTKRSANGFIILFEIPEVCYELGKFIM